MILLPIYGVFTKDVCAVVDSDQSKIPAPEMTRPGTKRVFSNKSIARSDLSHSAAVLVDVRFSDRTLGFIPIIGGIVSPFLLSAVTGGVMDPDPYPQLCNFFR
ncbi:hypothetical protein HQN64_12380 [Enterobacteriaceae bacterium BIT-l23]|uniref:Uncharacterized protein n=1 Tax=Jejubacter calystegiae TaxID=2579935 RepID=A0A4V1G770_9ENTR|nr:hypothetical protein [Jejubacter calystegiae]NUU66902.1 hypothetical protein [Enterobacteriaceae bacterium BIT-l23]QCT18617.1 hypothetical protein FEM41_02630 [Jejubacter calystegiae]